MSFGAISAEAKTALARGAEGAGTAICSGRRRDAARGAGRVHPLLLRARVGPLRLATRRARRGAGVAPQARPGRQDRHRWAPAGHQGRRPDRRGARPARGHAGGLAGPFHRLDDAARRARRSSTGCGSDRAAIPIGVKMSAQHIEEDIDAALDIGVDYVILDGRGGGTGAAPTIFRDTISVPTMAALARARRHLDLAGARDVTLVATGGFRRAQDMVKALALGADAIAVVQRRRSRRSAASACGPATPTTARWASPPRSRTCAPGCPSSGRPSS